MFESSVFIKEKAKMALIGSLHKMAPVSFGDVSVCILTFDVHIYCKARDTQHDFQLSQMIVKQSQRFLIRHDYFTMPIFLWDSQKSCSVSRA